MDHDNYRVMYHPHSERHSFDTDTVLQRNVFDLQEEVDYDGHEVVVDEQSW